MRAKRFAVIGDPIAHSKSPKMHSAAYRALAMSHSYEARHVRPSELEGVMNELRRGDYDGYNVTLPHKTRVLDYVDQVDASARLPGAANTIVRGETGELLAFNTDVRALTDELSALAPERDSGAWRTSHALVLGTGGAARAVLAALIQDLGVRRVVVRGRSANTPSFSEYVDHLCAQYTELTVGLAPLRAGGNDHFDVVVQATSVGVSGVNDGTVVTSAVDWTKVSPTAIAYDVVYGASPTPFLLAAQGAGLRACDGKMMLVRQGALAFERWLGVPAPIAVMQDAVFGTTSSS